MYPAKETNKKQINRERVIFLYTILTWNDQMCAVDVAKLKGCGSHH